MFSHMLFRIDGRFVWRVGLMLASLALSLLSSTHLEAQDSSSQDLTPSGLIAFAAGESEESLDIYVMKANGTELVRLTHDGGNDPAWSPDGRHIAFMSARDGNKEIYVMDADGRNVKRLTNNLADDGYPTWSPDGQHIAFMSGRGKSLDLNSRNDYDVYVMDPDGSNMTLLTHDTLDNGIPAWSPDGRFISFSTWIFGQWDIYTMKADGSDVTQLTFEMFDNGDSSWSPDGQHILFWAGPSDDWDVYTMNADGSHVVQLVDQAGNQALPVWSADGEYIAYVSYQEHGSDIYVIKADGTDKRRLTLSAVRNIAPAWQPLPQTAAP